MGPVVVAAGGEDVDVAVHYEPGTESAAAEVADDVGHVGLRGDDFGFDVVGMEVGDENVGGGAGVTWGVGGGCLSEALEEGDVGVFVGFYGFEEGLGIHDEFVVLIEEMRM